MATIVQSTSALLTALKSAQPGSTILLAPGAYSGVSLSNLSFSSAVTIASADPTHQAVISNLSVSNSSGLVFSGLGFTTTSGNAVSLANGSNNISFIGDKFFGSSTGVGNAMMIRDSGNVTVQGSDFGGFGTGINELNAKYVTIASNVFHDIVSGAIRGTGVTYATISGNTFADAKAAIANHSDVINLWQDNVANHVTIDTSNVYGAASTSNVTVTSPAPVTDTSSSVSSPVVTTPTPPPVTPAPTVPTTTDGATVTVSSTADLLKALKAAHAGDVIKLAAGNYDALVISNINIKGTVTIESATSTEAVLKGLTVSSSSGLAFKNLEVAMTGDVRGVDIGNSSNISVSDFNIHGAAGTNLGVGINLRNVSGVTVTDSEISQVGSGIAHLTSNEITISNNYLHSIGTDGIVGGGSTHVEVSGNTITEFHPPVGAHPDAIQFFSYAGRASADIVISNNVITRGAGEVTQGIFIEGAQGIEISGNSMAGTMYNGISVSATSDALIANNYVAGFSDMGSRIIVRGGSANVTVEHNTAQEIINYTGNGINPNYVQVDNKIIAASAVGDLSTMKAWLAQHVSLTTTLTGGEGDDLVTGAMGADNLTGGFGDDTYLVNNTGDVVVEAANGGVDTVKSSLSSYTLGANVENLSLTGASAQTGVGNSLNNVMTSNGVKSVLNGGAGNDSLISAGGADTLTGGAGQDVFGFSKVPTSAAVITDFTVGQDKLDLHNLLANYHGADPVVDKWLQVQSGTDGVTVLVDIDGASGSAGFTAVAKLSGVNALSASDWIFQ